MTEALNLIFSTGNLLLLAGLAAYFFYLRKKERELQRKEAGIVREAEKILGRAQDKAEEIVTGAQDFKDDLRKNLESVFERAVEKSVNSLEKDAGSLKNLYEHTFERVLERGVREELNRAAKEIADYKNEQKAKINERITQVVAQISREVLGKALSLEQHEQLIVEALDEAKKAGLFN